MRSTLLFVCVCLSLSMIGCSSSDGPPPFTPPTDGGPVTTADGAVCDPGDERVAAVYNGTREPTLLPLTPGEILAVARIDSGGGLCSGTVIAPRWVLTAEHCVSRGRASVWVGSNPDRVDQQIAVTRQIGHSSLDIALFELAEDATVAVPGLTPIRIADFSLTGLVGETGEAAGYGEQQNGALEQRRFSAEPIVAVRGNFTTIDGQGQRGVCFGDSGGPLMVLAEDNSVRVIGALSYGDPDCLGRDNYTRVDLARSWIESQTGMTPTTPTGCNGVTEAGTCRGSTAVWCENDELESDVCTGDERCMAVAGGRVACVPASSDPCGGVDFVGRCEGSVATWCEGSTLRRADCGSCGMTCTVDPVRGGAVCD